MRPKNLSRRIGDLLAWVRDDLLDSDLQHSIRVERILLEMVRPRRVLPEQLHLAFHNNHLTPTQ